MFPADMNKISCCDLRALSDELKSATIELWLSARCDLRALSDELKCQRLC